METKIEGKLQPKFRMIVLGCKAVGKTSLINQFLNNNFRSDYYPTKDLIIYKKLYNFTPNSGDVDDFCYIEIIDTMAYDRSKNLKDFSEFFLIHLVNEKDISKTNPNSKIPDSILKNIKHEYISGKDSNSAKGLFSNDKIMAYIFVFDYNDDKSLEEALELYNSISTDESLKIASESLRTVKCFVCNKYPEMIEDVPTDLSYTDVIKGYIDRDKRTGEIVSLIEKNLNRVVEKSEKQKIDFIFFTSTKFNLGVDNCFNSIFNKIKHKDDIYTKILCEENKDEDEKEEEQEKSEITTGFFCCKRKRVIEEKGLLNQSQKNQSYQEKLNFKDDDEEPGYDINVRIKPRSKVKKEEDEKKEISGGCYVY